MGTWNHHFPTRPPLFIFSKNEPEPVHGTSPFVKGCLGSLGVVLGRWGGGGPWLGESSGLSLVGSVLYLLRGGVSCLRGLASQ